MGMSKDKVTGILNDKLRGQSVGLRNVNRRLKRIYGYGVEIESEVGKGTTVSIKLPKDRGEVFD